MRRRSGAGSAGQTVVEFAACAVVTIMLLLVVVEFGRMVLAYTTVNNAARMGARYAIVHGTDNAVSTGSIQSVVNNYLQAAAIDTSSATVNVSYPGYLPLGCAVGSNNAGCPVQVSVSYPYQTMFSYFAIHVTLSSKAEGVITF